MGSVRASAGASAAFLVLLLGLLGCGGGDSGGGDSSSTVSNPLAGYPKGPTREFIVPGEDNAVQTFGREATSAEREEASRVIHRWMRARAAQNWTKDCSYLSRRYKHALVVTDARQVSKGKAQTCPQALAYFGHEASGSYKNNLAGPIDSLRVAEGHGYAQYHGDDGLDWIVPVDKEEGRWRVGNATPIERFK